ncbi:MAG: HEPN domain-containing protein [FCB group bacterium]|jgi:HEPN domain-containing protein
MSEIDNIINEWLTKADHDLGSAKLIFLHLPDYFDTIAFHCQQAVEKYLKAALIHYKIEFQRSHNLFYLLDLLSEKVRIETNLFEKVIKLNGFSIEIRYPNKVKFLSKEELEFSIEIAEFFRDFVLKQIGVEN